LGGGGESESMAGEKGVVFKGMKEEQWAGNSMTHGGRGERGEERPEVVFVTGLWGGERRAGGRGP